VPEELRHLHDYFERQELPPGAQVFGAGDPSDALFFVQTGQVVLLAAEPEPCGLGLARPAGVGDTRRLLRCTDGGIFGELGFFLEEHRTISAVIPSDGDRHSSRGSRSWSAAPSAAGRGRGPGREPEQPTVLFALSRASLQRLERERPQTAVLLQRALLRSLCEDIGSGVLESLSGLTLS
jgi:hypothetical protein